MHNFAALASPGYIIGSGNEKFTSLSSLIWRTGFLFDCIVEVMLSVFVTFDPNVLVSGFDHHDLQHGEVEQDLHPQDLADEQTDLAVCVQNHSARIPALHLLH